MDETDETDDRFAALAQLDLDQLTDDPPPPQSPAGIISWVRHRCVAGHTWYAAMCWARARRYWTYCDLEESHCQACAQRGRTPAAIWLQLGAFGAGATVAFVLRCPGCRTFYGAVGVAVYLAPSAWDDGRGWYSAPTPRSRRRRQEQCATCAYRRQRADASDPVRVPEYSGESALTTLAASRARWLTPEQRELLTMFQVPSRRLRTPPPPNEPPPDATSPLRPPADQSGDQRPQGQDPPV